MGRGQFDAGVNGLIRLESDQNLTFPYDCNTVQGSKLTLANLENASYFGNLPVKKISTSKCLRVRIMQISQTFEKNLLVVSTVCQWKKWIKMLTSSSAV